MGFTCFSRPRPNRKVQLIVDVKWGIHEIPRGVWLLNRLRIRGILRYDTTAFIINKIQRVRIWFLSFTPVIVRSWIALFFFYTDTFEISDLSLEFSDFFSVAFGLFPVFTVFSCPLDAFSFPIFTAFYQF